MDSYRALPTYHCDASVHDHSALSGLGRLGLPCFFFPFSFVWDFFFHFEHFTLLPRLLEGLAEMRIRSGRVSGI